MAEYASNENGRLYVVSKTSFGRTSEQLIAAASLKDAKMEYGWSGMRYTYVTVRRATVEDVRRLHG